MFTSVSIWLIGTVAAGGGQMATAHQPSAPPQSPVAAAPWNAHTPPPIQSEHAPARWDGPATGSSHPNPMPIPPTAISPTAISPTAAAPMAPAQKALSPNTPQLASASTTRIAASTPTGSAVSAAMAATVRLRVEDASGVSFGTGTIVDMHGGEALVLTCGHIFRESKGSGKILCDSFAPGARQQVMGTLVSYNVRRDVGLISFEPGVAITPMRVGNVGDQPKTGDHVFAIGCNQGDPATVIQNRVLAVNRYHGPANLVVGGRPIDGRSGGGLFADDGTLVGVCNAADQQADEGVYAALGPIHTELDNAGLDFVYRTDRQPLGAHEAEPSDMAANLNAPAAYSGSPAPSSPLAASEPAPTAEVIYIWRDPLSEGERKVVVIDQPSPRLLQNLNAELDRRGVHTPTEHRVPPSAGAGSWHSTYAP